MMMIVWPATWQMQYSALACGHEHGGVTNHEHGGVKGALGSAHSTVTLAPRTTLLNQAAAP
jgi:hypothetical protein